MKMVFASVLFSSPLPVAVARTSQSPFPLWEMLFELSDIKRNFDQKQTNFNANGI